LLNLPFIHLDDLALISVINEHLQTFSLVLDDDPLLLNFELIAQLKLLFLVLKILELTGFPL